MSDVLVRGLTDAIIAAIDSQAAQLGLSRSEYLRRRLIQEAQRTTGVTVTVDDLRRFADRFADLQDDTVMRGAWE